MARHYPQIIKAGLVLDWAWLGHGKTNSILPVDMTRDEERAYLTEVIDTIAVATGRRPRGWMGQALEFLAAQPDIWLTTSDEIAAHYQRTAG